MKKVTKKIKSPLKVKDVTFVAEGTKIPAKVSVRVNELLGLMGVHNNGCVLMVCKVGEDKDGASLYDATALAHNTQKSAINKLIAHAIKEFGLLPLEFAKFAEKDNGTKKQS